ncbi:MAG: hypothetical protein U0Z26_10205 [Anaerolineales bacterium]
MNARGCWAKFSKVAAYSVDYSLGKKYFLQALDALGKERVDSEKEWWNAWFKLYLIGRIEYDIDNIKELQEVFSIMHPKIERIEDTDLLAEYYFLFLTMIFRRTDIWWTRASRQYTKLSLDLELMVEL